MLTSAYVFTPVSVALDEEFVADYTDLDSEETKAFVRTVLPEVTFHVLY